MSRIDGTYIIQKRNFASEPCPFCTGRVKNRPEKEFKTVVKYHHFTYPATLYLNLYSCRECAAANLKEKASARKLAMFFSAIVSLAVFMRLIHHDVFYAVLFMLLMFFLSWMLFHLFLLVLSGIVYGKKKNYMADIIEKKYKWTTTYPEDVDFSKAPSEQEFDRMLAKMLEECDCEIVK